MARGLMCVESPPHLRSVHLLTVSPSPASKRTRGRQRRANAACQVPNFSERTGFANVLDLSNYQSADAYAYVKYPPFYYRSICSRSFLRRRRIGRRRQRRANAACQNPNFQRESELLMCWISPTTNLGTLTMTRPDAVSFRFVRAHSFAQYGRCRRPFRPSRSRICEAEIPLPVAAWFAATTLGSSGGRSVNKR
jgi:hypothetical protein